MLTIIESATPGCAKQNWSVISYDCLKDFDHHHLHPHRHHWSRCHCHRRHRYRCHHHLQHIHQQCAGRSAGRAEQRRGRQENVFIKRQTNNQVIIMVNQFWTHQIGIEDHPVLCQELTSVKLEDGTVFRTRFSSTTPRRWSTRTSWWPIQSRALPGEQRSREGGQLNHNLAANPFTLQRCKSNEQYNWRFAYGYVCTSLINELSGLSTSTTCPWNIKRSTTAWRWFVKKKHNIVSIKPIWRCWKNWHLHQPAPLFSNSLTSLKKVDPWDNPSFAWDSP